MQCTLRKSIAVPSAGKLSLSAPTPLAMFSPSTVSPGVGAGDEGPQGRGDIRGSTAYKLGFKKEVGFVSTNLIPILNGYLRTNLSL